jgi:hypothetical protein
LLMWMSIYLLFQILFSLILEYCKVPNNSNIGSFQFEHSFHNTTQTK